MTERLELTDLSNTATFFDACITKALEQPSDFIQEIRDVNPGDLHDNLGLALAYFVARGITSLACLEAQAKVRNATDSSVVFREVKQMVCDRNSIRDPDLRPYTQEDVINSLNPFDAEINQYPSIADLIKNIPDKISDALQQMTPEERRIAIILSAQGYPPTNLTRWKKVFAGFDQSQLTSKPLTTIEDLSCLIAESLSDPQVYKTLSLSFLLDSRMRSRWKNGYIFSLLFSSPSYF
jgi:hypothetical protein